MENKQNTFLPKQKETFTQPQSPNTVPTTKITNEQKLESLSNMIQSVDQYLKKNPIEK